MIGVGSRMDGGVWDGTDWITPLDLHSYDYYSTCRVKNAMFKFSTEDLFVLSKTQCEW